MQQRIQQYFANSIAVKTRAMHQLGPVIEQAGSLIAGCMDQGGKLLICGNGGSAADAQHFSSELLHQFRKKRRALPAIALTTDSSTITAIANDDDYRHIFSRQIMALGCPGDVLFVISTSGASGNILAAISVAHQKHLSVIALTGRDGGALAQSLSHKDIEIRVPSEVTSHIQETHIMIIHYLCDRLDEHITLGEKSS